MDRRVNSAQSARSTFWKMPWKAAGQQQHLPTWMTAFKEDTSSGLSFYSLYYLESLLEILLHIMA
jgi:hypothetical protein